VSADELLLIITKTVKPPFDYALLQKEGDIYKRVRIIRKAEIFYNATSFAGNNSEWLYDIPIIEAHEAYNRFFFREHEVMSGLLRGATSARSLRNVLAGSVAGSGGGGGGGGRVIIQSTGPITINGKITVQGGPGGSNLPTKDASSDQ
jgi:hypothetical protein